MRLRGRRRPAGVEWVPNEVFTPEVVVQPLGPIVLRLGPGSGLLDFPGGLGFDAVANVWLADGRWVEATWPRDPTYGWFIAPIDLRLGQVVEFGRGGSIITGWVADVNVHRFVFVVTANREEAWRTAGLAFDRWSEREIGRLR